MCSILGNTRRPDIRFRNDGRIDIFANMVDMLDIHPGDVIDIWSEDGEQFLYVRRKSEDIRGKHIAICRECGGHVRIWCVKLCRYILSQCNSSEAAFYAGEPVVKKFGKAVPLITRNNLQK